MSYDKKDYFDFCDWAVKKYPDLSDISLSREFTQRDKIYMEYLASQLLED